MLCNIIKFALNLLQFTCCGVNGPEDWKVVFPNKTLPAVCCPDKDVSQECTLGGPIPYSKNGCLVKFEKIMHDKALLAGGIGLSVCFIQVMYYES